MGRLLRWLRSSWEQLRREARVPTPPFRACKRTGVIMYGVWYGRLTPQQARELAAAWEFPPEAIEQMIAEATQPPSYWSQSLPGREASG